MPKLPVNDIPSRTLLAHIQSWNYNSILPFADFAAGIARWCPCYVLKPPPQHPSSGLCAGFIVILIHVTWFTADDAFGTSPPTSFPRWWQLWLCLASPCADTLPIHKKIHNRWLQVVLADEALTSPSCETLRDQTAQKEKAVFANHMNSNSK